MTAVARANEYQVTVVAPVPYYPPIKLGWRSGYAQVAKEQVIEGIQVYHPRYLMVPKIGMFLHGVMMGLSVLAVIRKIQKSFNFDLIDAHYVYPDGFAAVLLGRLLRRPVIVSARGSDINAFATLPLIRRLIAYTLHRADHVIAVSGALRQAIREIGISSGKITLIPNGVDQRKFKKIPKEEARKLLGLPLDRDIALSVGGLNPLKGFDLLIRSFKLLMDESKNRKPYLVIVGDGLMREELKLLIRKMGLESDAHLVGGVSHSELYRWYSAADVFCLVSEREGYPNVLLEALACGTPVVATAVGGVPEIVCSDSLGFITERLERNIADKIRDAFSKTWDAEQIASTVRRCSWEGAAHMVTGVFESVLNISSRRSQSESQPSSARKAIES